MNFEEWYKQTYVEDDYLIKGVARDSWNACKEQVLHILANAPRNNPNLMSGFQMNQQTAVEKQIKSL